MSPINPQVEEVMRVTKTAITAIDLTLQGLVIKDEDTYQSADHLLSQARILKKRVDDRMDPAIGLIRAGLDKLYEIKRDLVKPLDSLIDGVKKKMALYKVEEQRAIVAAARKKAEEEAKLTQQLEQKEEALENAKTPQMKGRLESAKRLIEEQRLRAATAPLPEVARATGSTTRKILEYSVTNPTLFYAAIANGDLPSELAPPDLTAIKRWAKENGVSAAVGIEVSERITIAGR